MRPQALKTKIFLDSGDPNDTKEALSILGFLDGQTTNPTLMSKNPFIKEQLEKGKKFKKDELLNFYKDVVIDIASYIPHGSISIEVYSDASSVAADMINEAKEMYTWIPNSHIKFPITPQGLRAAMEVNKSGVRVNMTLCFTQQQAAAVYSATKFPVPQEFSMPGFANVFISPFIGRLDDKGENGVFLIKNILEMYKNGDGHVWVLAASIRSLRHLLYSFAIGAEIVTAPLGVLREWAEKGMPVPQEISPTLENPLELLGIAYEDIDMNQAWERFNLSHELTDKGIDKFSVDWNSLVKTE